jgi:hypothetical protein
VTARQHLVSQARLQLALGLPLAFLLGLGAPLARISHRG